MARGHSTDPDRPRHGENRMTQMWQDENCLPSHSLQLVNIKPEIRCLPTTPSIRIHAAPRSLDLMLAARRDATRGRVGSWM
jgi:hypothetical protein